MEERRDALIRRSLGQRANITVCVHGINVNHCTPCNTKKPSRSKKVAAIKPAEVKAEEPNVPESAAEEKTSAE